MVTSFETPSRTTKARIAIQNINPKSSPAFPLSSPPTEQLTSFKPSNAEAVHSSGNPFLSTNTFASSSSDDESGSSSGLDEFQLERYSESKTEARHTQRSYRKPPSRDEARKRPGLNIVTNFSNSGKRTHTDGLLIDEVQSQRPRMKQRYATSIISAKAEHGHHSPYEAFQSNQFHDNNSVWNATSTIEKASQLENHKRALGREALTRLQALQAARKKATKDLGHSPNLVPKSHGDPDISRDSEHGRPLAMQTTQSPDKRSIVIGLSIPEDEAEAHKLNNSGDSALSMYTPDTPAIIVTSAEDVETWKTTTTTTTASKIRPPSSLYSAAPWAESAVFRQDFPPVPKIPQSLPQKLATNTATRRGITTNKHHCEHDKSSDQDFDDEHYDNDIGPGRRASAESKEHILSSQSDGGRHKSQGWWNLMLSPMLSRKGTLKSIATLDVATPPLPSMPDHIQQSKGITSSPVSSQSPGTPRRFGLASARASVWSRWTTWERSRDGIVMSNEKTVPYPSSAEQRHVADDSSNVLPESFSHSGEGYAAEYYHACAVDQVKGVKYFECQNHSCSEQLPKLHSIFDARSLAVISSEDGGEVRSSPQTQANGTSDAPMVERALSSITIRTEPEELSPNVRQANTAAVVQAKSIDSLAKPTASNGQETGNKGGLVEEDPTNANVDVQKKPAQLDRSVSRRDVEFPNIATVVPSSQVQPLVPSPGPVSPGMQQTMASRGAVPMAEIASPPVRTSSPEQTQAVTPSDPWSQMQPSSVTIHNHTTYTERNVAQNPFLSEMERREEAASQPVPAASVPGPTSKSPAKEVVSKSEAQEETKQRGSLLSKLKCLRRTKKSNPNEPKKPTKRYWNWVIAVLLFLIVVACVLTAMFLTRTGDGTPVQSQWLNLTGYPPMPTGISTIARPDVRQQSQCVVPSTLWSCALPKENQAEVTPNAPDQPNFRFQIAFQNGTVPANMTIPLDRLSKRSSTLNSRASNPFSTDLFEPNPQPPSRADQIFMGNTTDNITQPFDGEKTPFFITFVPVFPVDPTNTTESTPPASTSRLRPRQDNNGTDSIPAPDVLDDGSAAPANLLPTEPYPTSQPIKLYNRGLQDEHYGFYMYYDKSIFLRSRAPFNGSSATGGNDIDSADENGGSTRNQAQFRCTFSQTRFLVRMWTNPAFGAKLLPPLTDANSTRGNEDKANSATDFSRPGSFPYPTTITIDRHGGNVNKKTAYCYGVDGLQVIQADIKTLIPEARGINGNLINAAPRLVNGTGLDEGFDQNAGGIDGGTGGCNCIWQNWN